MNQPDSWKREVLTHVSPFQACNHRQLDDFARLADVQHLDTGAVLCRQGDAGDDTYVIAEGAVVVSIDGVDVATLAAGELVGEQAILHYGRRNATVRAVQPTTVLVIDAREIDCMLAAVPSAARSYGIR